MRNILSIAFWCVLAVITIAVRSVSATNVWETLPATPTLPTAIETGYVSVNGIKIWYGIYGSSLTTTLAAKKTPVLFLHGGLANSDYWGNQIPTLAKLNLSLILVDTRGQGRTADGSANLTYDLMASDFLGVLDHFSIKKVNIIGWSDGGITGLDLAINNPSRVAGLWAYGASYSYANTNSSASSNSLVVEFVTRAYSEYQKLNPNSDGFSDYYTKITAMWEVLPDYVQSSFAKISSSLASRIWIVDGDKEEVINLDTPYTLHKWIKGSVLHILTNVSHYAGLQDPTQFTNSIVSFLKS